MSIELLQSPACLPPSDVLKIAQQAPSFLSSHRRTRLPFPLSLFISTESPELWVSYENLFYACLRTGDDESARECLDRLTERFGEKNERIMALRGLYHEATAQSIPELQKLADGYQDVLKEDPANMPIRKRRAALLKSVGQYPDAIKALCLLVEASPTDAEAWLELGELYWQMGIHEKATFCLEECLLITPNAWNIHARLGEILYVSSSSQKSDLEKVKLLTESLRRYCRSVELCDDYLRGHYGLELVCKRLLDLNKQSLKDLQKSLDEAADDLEPLYAESVQRLHELATSRLAEIVRRGASKEKGWEGYDEAELIAAKALLDRDTQTVLR